MFKKVTWVGIYGPHTQVKALIFWVSVGILETSM